MNLQQTLTESIQTAWVVLKYVVPIYVLADVLFYYNVFSHIAFVAEPVTAVLDLPPEASLSLISGMLLNVYGAIAFAAPLDLSAHQWTTLAVFVGINHSLIVENAIIRQLGISMVYSYGLRIVSAFVVGYLTAIVPSEWFSGSATMTQPYVTKHYDSFAEMIQTSFVNAGMLSLKVIALITLLIVLMNFIKSLPIIQRSQKHVSKIFSLVIGYILGITYGAGILINEAKSGSMSHADLFFVGTFLMIAHAVIEDTLLFVIFGADFTVAVAIRTLAAIVIAYGLAKVYTRYYANK